MGLDSSINVRLTPEERDQLTQQAALEGRTISNLVRFIITQFLSRKET